MGASGKSGDGGDPRIFKSLFEAPFTTVLTSGAHLAATQAAQRLRYYEHVSCERSALAEALNQSIC